jgi:DNA invertase Pin-like site-specific DNA recombinase
VTVLRTARSEPEIRRSQLDRDYIREKTLEGQQAAAAHGNHGGRPEVIDEDDVLFARALREKGTPMPDIVKKLTITTGKNASRTPRSPRSTEPSPTTKPDQAPPDHSAGSSRTAAIHCYR